MFNNREYLDMLLIYGEAHQSSAAARRMYADRFPNRRTPNRRTFVDVCQRVLDSGSVGPRSNERGQQRQIPVDVEEQILDIVDNNPGSSTRDIARQVQVSRTTVHRTLREQLLYPYHLQRVQALAPADFPPRLNFCRWFGTQVFNNPNFLSSILVTDEACFTRDGILNLHNMHNWSEANPHQIIQTHFQHRFSINVWAGILGDHVIGPYVLPERLTGNTYLFFLENVLPDLLEEIPLNIRAEMWYLHDGAPPHASRQVVQYLNTTFNDRWIGRNGPHRWPARSPDMNPLDFYFWGHMKTLVYSAEIPDVNVLRQRIFDAAQQIRTTPGIFQRIRENWLRRTRACIEANGGHFEHLL